MQVSFTVGRAVRPLFIFLLLSVVACATKKEPIASGPQQSPNDDFAYRLLTLENGLQTLLISNPDSPKAAASLDVHVGSGDNPADRGGLAHFLEHMLFLGTEKYPDSAEYERYITEHGGSRNAYTSFEHTNYFFDIDAVHLDGALDRFAQFFIAPNFDGDYVERERNAVEAEYQMGLKSDGRRGLDVLQASMNGEHPFSRFAVGSLETLADRDDAKIRDDLLSFYEQYYSANVMRLVVLGQEPLNALEDMVRDRFGAIPNRDVELERIDEPLYVDSQLPMLLKVKPQGTLRQLQVNFQIPDYRGDYMSKPMSYISNLVGHEGAGSLLSHLKTSGLADGLSSGTGLSWRGGAMFSVSISLTEQGVADYERVLQGVFAYLSMLRDQPPQERLYSEQSSLAELAFRFREPSAPIGYVSSLSNSMHYYADNDLLRGPYLMTEFDAETIGDALGRLTPDRAQVVLTAPEVRTNRESPYYGVPYAEMGPETLVLSRWQSDAIAELQLPKANPFIAGNVDLYPLAEENPAIPELRVDESRKRIWFKQSQDFRVPKGALYLSFRSPLVNATAAQKASASLYTRMVTDALNEYTYPALLAGLGFNLYNHAQGISMRISGYSDKQLTLLDELLKSMASQQFDAARFERIRREMVLELENTVARRPTSQLMNELRRTLNDREYSESQMIEALSTLDLEALDSYREGFWASVRAEAMLYGNYQPAAVETLASTLDRVLTGDEGELALAPDVLRVPADSNLGLQATIEHDDAVVVWYLQGANQSLEERAAVALSAQVVQSGFFQQLRTEQQLGYVVSSFAWPQYDVPALALLVQSPSHSAPDVYLAMREFLVNTPAQISAEQYERHRGALVNDILKPQENLGERAEFYWQSIATREWEFDGPQRLADAVASMSYEEWSRYFQASFVDKPRSILAFSAGARGDVPELPDSSLFSAPTALSKGLPRYAIDLAPL
ncbi:MAG: insulinase family protein [Congregibacter sp.]